MARCLLLEGGLLAGVGGDGGLALAGHGGNGVGAAGGGDGAGGEQEGQGEEADGGFHGSVGGGVAERLGFSCFETKR